MTTADIDAMCDAARARLAQHLNRSAAQHARRMRHLWSTWGAPVTASALPDASALQLHHTPAAHHQHTKSPVPPEAGNVWFLDDEPDEDTPLHWAEQLLVSTAKVIFAFVAVGCAAFVTGVLVSHL